VLQNGTLKLRVDLWPSSHCTGHFWRACRQGNSDIRLRRAPSERYDEDRWLGQPYFPIFIVEKDTMEPVCQPMAQRWQMAFASSRGYSSLKL